MRRGGVAYFLVSGASAVALAQAAPAHGDTLQEALTEAYLNNPSLLAARANQRATDENVQIQEAPGIPSVNASGTYIEFIKKSPNSFTSPDRTLQVGPELTVPVYAGGAIRNAVKAAEERVAAGQNDLRATESAIFSQVVAAYMDVLRAEALVSLSGNQVEFLTVNLEAASDRFEIGDLTRTDVAQSQSRLALARGDLRSAEAGLIQARETYIQLVGSAPGELEPPPPLPNLPDDPRSAVDVALENNPDLIAARERAQAAGYDIDVAGASRLPRISAFAGYDYQNFLGSIPGSLSDPTNPNSAIIPSDQDARASSAGISLSIPIFQGGRPAALQRQAQARASAALDQVIAFAGESVRVEEVMDHTPVTASAVAVPTTPAARSDVTVTVLERSADPLMTGSVMLVMSSSSALPESLSTSRSGTLGMAGSVRSTVIDRAMESALVLPARSTVVAVRL